jgi:nitrite reductase (NADH) small subunit
MMSGTKWVRLCQLEDIPVRGARVVRTESGCVALFRTAEQEVFALDDKCPHKSGRLSQGIVHGRSVTCPLHGWVISLETGKALGADEGQVRTIPLKVENGTISVGSEVVKSANIGAVAAANNTNNPSTLPRKQGKL